MLKQRVITGLVLAAVLLCAVFFLSLQYFALLAGLVFVVAAWEWAQFARLGSFARVLFALVFAVIFAAVSWWIGLFGDPLIASRVLTIVAVGTVWWCLAAVFVKSYPAYTYFWSAPVIQFFIGLLVIVPTWVSLVFLRSQPMGQWLIVILVLCVVCADTGAYFVGRKWGKNKLAPKVSPGKSMEGFYGGFVASILFALILTLSLGRPQDWWLFAFIVPASLVSVLGDLLESMLKRERGVKDSGRILPGHGGILDRVDSITAAAPIFTVGYILSAWHW